jgi:hypothetical protein
MNLGGGWGDAFGQEAIAQHGVEKGGLARIKFAHHDQEKQFLKLGEGALEQCLIVVWSIQAR